MRPEAKAITALDAVLASEAYYSESYGDVGVFRIYFVEYCRSIHWYYLSLYRCHVESGFTYSFQTLPTGAHLEEMLKKSPIIYISKVHYVAGYVSYMGRNISPGKAPPGRACRMPWFWAWEQCILCFLDVSALTEISCNIGGHTGITWGSDGKNGVILSSVGIQEVSIQSDTWSPLSQLSLAGQDPSAVIFGSR